MLILFIVIAYIVLGLVTLFLFSSPKIAGKDHINIAMFDDAASAWVGPLCVITWPLFLLVLMMIFLCKLGNEIK